MTALFLGVKRRSDSSKDLAKEALQIKKDKNELRRDFNKKLDERNKLQEKLLNYFTSEKNTSNSQILNNQSNNNHGILKSPSSNVPDAEKRPLQPSAHINESLPENKPSNGSNDKNASQIDFYNKISDTSSSSEEELENVVPHNQFHDFNGRI